MARVPSVEHRNRGRRRMPANRSLSTPMTNPASVVPLLALPVVLLLVGTTPGPAESFRSPRRVPARSRWGDAWSHAWSASSQSAPTATIMAATSTTVVEYQSDDQYDRGDMHISACVDEGDTIVYRTGSWYVDGVLVGEEDALPTYELCRVETIQVVWTHNCEHGVLRGLAVDLVDHDQDHDHDPGVGDHDHETKEPPFRLSLRTPLEDVEFGPEQIVARICNLVWEPDAENCDGEIGTSSIPLDPLLWKEHDANADDDDDDDHEP